MKLIFFGTPDFAAHVLSYLLAHGLKFEAVVTKPDRPKGRSLALLPTPVKQVAVAQNIPLYQPEKASDLKFAELLASYKADLFVVVAYGEILKSHILALPKKGCINLHASLLPKYRGASPIQRSLIEGEKETGVTIMYMAEKMDAGDILEVAKVPIGPNMTFPELEHTLCQEGAKALLNVIVRLQHSQLKGIKQDPTLATLAPKIELEDCEIDWQKPAQSIHNLVRGVTPHPGAFAFVFIKGKKLRLKVNRTRCIEELQGKPGGLLAYGKKGLVVACGQGALELLEVQLEGKKAMPAKELMLGIAQEQFLLFKPLEMS